MLVLGGGSNLLVADDGFDGTVVPAGDPRDRRRGLRRLLRGVAVRVAAGRAVGPARRAMRSTQGWSGVEALSGVPGSTGATPMQNVGAYGQEVAEPIARVRTWDRQQGRVRTLANADCEFGYRSSRLKEERFRDGPRFVVLEVTFQLALG